MRTIPTLCVLLIALPVWAGTFRDDFEDGNFYGWTTSGAAESFLVENGELVLKTPLFFPDGISIEIGDESWIEELIKYL
jgi:hypothetical protein